MFDHGLELRVWDTKDKCGQKARFDRIKSLKLPPPKPGEVKGAGVKNLVMKQSKNYEKLQPKRNYINRPLPNQPRPDPVVALDIVDTTGPHKERGMICCFL